MEQNEYTTEETEIISSIKLSIHRALWGEVIPSLRQILLKWKPEDGLVLIRFYHHGKITDSIENHYSCVITEVDAGYYGRPLKIDYEVIRLDYPEPLPREQFVVYLRREPFENPTDLE